MREVHAEATTGYCVLLDQCPACGGIWCDRWELYPVTGAAAAKIDRVDGDTLQRPLAADPLATQISEKPPPTVAGLGNAFEPAASPTAPSDVTEELTRGAVWLIVRAL